MLKILCQLFVSLQICELTKKVYTTVLCSAAIWTSQESLYNSIVLSSSPQVHFTDTANPSDILSRVLMLIVLNFLHINYLKPSEEISNFLLYYYSYL